MRRYRARAHNEDRPRPTLASRKLSAIIGAVVDTMSEARVIIVRITPQSCSPLTRQAATPGEGEETMSVRTVTGNLATDPEVVPAGKIQITKMRVLVTRDIRIGANRSGLPFAR